MNLSRGMSNEIQVATIALPFRSSLTTLDSDSRIAELPAKKCAARQKSYNIMFYFFNFFLVAARASKSVYQNNSCMICDDVVKTDIFMENL